jgi:catechol 2,3-dioxygenase-like lactoylglutathione lyase family enzyme
MKSFRSTMEFALSISLATQTPMQHFYRSILNLTPAGSLSFAGFEISAYRFGNSILKLALPPEDMQPESKTPDFKNGFISLRITDVEAVLKEAEREGVKVFIPLMEGEVGETGKAKAAFLVDPMGNLVEVVEILEGRVAWD